MAEIYQLQHRIARHLWLILHFQLIIYLRRHKCNPKLDDNLCVSCVFKLSLFSSFYCNNYFITIIKQIFLKNYSFISLIRSRENSIIFNNSDYFFFLYFIVWIKRQVFLYIQNKNTINHVKIKNKIFIDK